jgi:hypothetical protein
MHMTETCSNAYCIPTSSPFFLFRGALSAREYAGVSYIKPTIEMFKLHWEEFCQVAIIFVFDLLLSPTFDGVFDFQSKSKSMDGP